MFLFLSTDEFRNIDNLPSDSSVKKEDKFPGNPIRRPYRGIQIKDDTYSTLSVRRPDGSAIPLISSSDLNGSTRAGRIGLVAEYADYILQSVQDQRVEKQQIIETFGDPFVYFFGERPRIVSFSGLLMNTEDFNWRAQFWRNYDRFLRGTRLVQSNARAYLSYDTVVIEGYPLSANAVDDQSTPYSIPFQMQMLVTNYYDSSSVGQTRFPGFGEEIDLKFLNKELENERNKFVSTGSQVREQNLAASLRSGGGLLSTLRNGIRAVNNAISSGTRFADKIHNVIGGRTVRVPIGIAGFLNTTGAPVIAQGSITAGFALRDQFDAATGGLKNLNGSVKLRVPGNATYAPPWISTITDSPRGFIHENVDEYPKREQEKTIYDLLKFEDSFDLTERQVERHLAVQENSALLMKHNILAESQFLGDLAEGVAFVKSNFGMAMSAAAFIKDPLSVVKASLGIGIGTTSSARISEDRISDPSDPEGTLKAKGIKTQSREGAIGTFGGPIGKYVGFSAAQTFANLNENNVQKQAEGDFSLASQGEVYDSAAYSPTGSTAGLAPEDRDYEAAYGDSDYSALVDQDPSTQASLDEIYGNNDAAPEGSDIDPASLDDVYGTGSTSSSVRTPEQIAAALQAAQSTDIPQDEDTSGIIAVLDDGAQIDPVV
jgi:hypothetical protein